MHVFAVLAAAFSLWSPGFTNGARLPRDYTCVGKGISPPLSWSHVPRRAHALALEVTETNYTPGFRPVALWTLWNLPVSQHSLAAGAHWRLVGRNGRGRIGYSAPCAPVNEPSIYFFELYALKRPLRLPRGASPARFERALRGDVIAEARLGAKMVRCDPPDSCG